VRTKKKIQKIQRKDESLFLCEYLSSEKWTKLRVKYKKKRTKSENSF
jgi:hypothetical protein